MTSEDRKNYSEAFKNYVIAISVIIGGLWSFYVFTSRLEVLTSRAQLDKLKLESTARPILMTKLEISLLEDNGKTKILKIYVHIENQGNMDTSLYINQESLSVAQVSLNKGEIVSYKNIIRTGEKWIPPSNSGIEFSSFENITYLAGQKKSRLYLVELEETGLYQIDFVAEPSSEVLDTRNKINIFGSKKAAKPILHFVSASEYIYID